MLRLRRVFQFLYTIYVRIMRTAALEISLSLSLFFCSSSSPRAGAGRINYGARRKIAARGKNMVRPGMW